MRHPLVATWVASVMLAGTATAQTVPATPEVATPAAAVATVPAPVPAPVNAPPPGYIRIPAGTVVDIEITDTLTSKTAKIDDFFALKLRQPIQIDGRVAVPAAVTGRGQIVHAAKARALGKGGELIIAARAITCGSVEIGLRGFKLGGQGDDYGTAMGATIAVVGVIAAPIAFMSGGEKVIPSGVRGFAKTSAMVDIPIDATCAVATAPAPVAPITAPVASETKDK